MRGVNEMRQEILKAFTQRGAVSDCRYKHDAIVTFVDALRERQVTRMPPRYPTRRTSAIDGRTRRHPGSVDQ